MFPVGVRLISFLGFLVYLVMNPGGLRRWGSEGGRVRVRFVIQFDASGVKGVATGMAIHKAAFRLVLLGCIPSGIVYLCRTHCRISHTHGRWKLNDHSKRYCSIYKSSVNNPYIPIDFYGYK